MKRDIVLPALAGFLFLWGLSEGEDICQRAVFEQGISLPTCPAGRIRQTAEVAVSDLRRGVEGNIYLGATAHYTLAGSESIEHAPNNRFESIKISLVDSAGKATPLKARNWNNYDGASRMEGKLKLFLMLLKSSFLP